MRTEGHSRGTVESRYNPILAQRTVFSCPAEPVNRLRGGEKARIVFGSLRSPRLLSTLFPHRGACSQASPAKS